MMNPLYMIDCTSEIVNTNHLSEGERSRRHMSEKYFASAETEIRFLLFPSLSALRIMLKEQ